KDYTTWSNKMLSPERLKKHQAYWTEHLEGTLPESEFPLDYKRPAQKTWRGINRTEWLSVELSEQISTLGVENKASFFMVIMAAVKALYYRYTMESDVVFGTTITARNHYNLENQIGFYTSTLPIRTVFDPNSTFLDLLDLVQQNMLGAFDHQWYQFDQIVNDLKIKRPKNKYPVFNTLVALRNTDDVLLGDEGEEGLIKVENADETNIWLSGYTDIVFPVSKYDLTLRVAMEPIGQISLYIEHNIDLYKTETIDLWTQRLLKILNVIVERPEIRIKEIPLIGESGAPIFAEQNTASFFDTQF
ncbi:MAG: condensation domain-containing protein, partial [Bacteroidota bacterium]